MQISRTEAIVLHLFKYSEHQLIVHLLTKDSGRQSFLTYASKRNGSRRSLFQPLQIIEFTCTQKKMDTMPFLSNVEIKENLVSILTNPMKSSIAMFISELLYRLVTEPLDDKNMYDFLEKAIISLENFEEGYANFHLWFMIHFASMMGWGLPQNYNNGDWIDIQSGVCTKLPPSSKERIAPEYAGIIYKINECEVSELSRVELSKEVRRVILESLIEYYRYHSDNFGQINSLDVFKDIF